MGNDGLMERERKEEIHGMLRQMIEEEGLSLSFALEKLQDAIPDPEWIEVQAEVGAACRYEYYAANDIDETIHIDTPRGSWNAIDKWEEFVAEHYDAMDPKRVYLDTLDVAATMGGLDE